MERALNQPIRHSLIVLSSTCQAQAEQLAQEYGFNLSHALPQNEAFYLCLDEQGLSLKQGDAPRTSVQVDFIGGSNGHRRKFGGGLGQDIAKAVGVSGAYQPTVLDATAGLGRDAFVLASLGCEVRAFERHPVVAALLADGLARAARDAETHAIIASISLAWQSSLEGLAQACAAQQPDIIYLDPMFAHDHKQKALVKKEMAAFHGLVGQDEDADELLELALNNARCRVVVKRARKARPLANRPPSYSLVGKANRFDVYALAKVEPPELAQQQV